MNFVLMSCEKGRSILTIIDHYYFGLSSYMFYRNIQIMEKLWKSLCIIIEKFFETFFILKITKQHYRLQQYVFLFAA